MPQILGERMDYSENGKSEEVNIKINSKQIKDLNIKYIQIPHISVVSLP